MSKRKYCYKDQHKLQFFLKRLFLQEMQGEAMNVLNRSFLNFLSFLTCNKPVSIIQCGKSMKDNLKLSKLMGPILFILKLLPGMCPSSSLALGSNLTTQSLSSFTTITHKVKLYSVLLFISNNKRKMFSLYITLKRICNPFLSPPPKLLKLQYMQ